ncbi:MAG: hypothetical protein ACRDJC_13860, partial [Thermomicrobiales bacterium]
VPVPAVTMSEPMLQAAFARFARIHAEKYGYAIEGEEIELVAFHVTVMGRRAAPRLVSQKDEGDVADPSSRLVHFRGAGDMPTAVYRRYGLPEGTRIDGPVILEEPGSTTLVEPGMTVEVLPDGQLLIETGLR